MIDLMRIKGIGILITFRVILRFWIWLLNQLFASRSSKQKFSLKSLGFGALLVVFLYLYKYVLVRIGREHLLFVQNFSSSALWIFLGYILLFTFFLLLLFQNFRKIPLWMQWIVGAISFLLIGMVGIKSGIQTTIMYFIILSYAEELLKISLSSNQTARLTQQSYSKLLFFSLSIGLAFALLENLLSLIVQKEVGILIGRGIFSVMLHLVATGTIALIIIRTNHTQIPLILRFFFALLVGTLIHGMFNFALAQQLSWLSILLLIGSGIWMSYLLFNTDELYEKQA